MVPLLPACSSILPRPAYWGAVTPAVEKAEPLDAHHVRIFRSQAVMAGAKSAAHLTQEPELRWTRGGSQTFHAP